MRNKRRLSAALVLMASLAVLLGQSSMARESSADIGEFNFPGDSVVLRLTKDGMHPKVEIDFGDGKQYNFIVDTGASVNVIDSSIAQSLGYEVVGETEIGAPGGPQIPGNIVKVPLVQIGDATIENAEFVTMDVIGFSHGMTQGVIGVGTFSDYLVAYNLGGGQITISRNSLSADDPGVISYNGSNGQIEIEVDVAGTAVGAHIDTGSMGGLMLPAEMIDSIPLKAAPAGGAKARLVGSERDIKFAALNGSIRFAGLEFDDQNVAFMSPSTGHGNIGGRILGELIMSIDQKNQLIGFQEISRMNVAANDNKPRRLGVQFRGMPGGSVLTVGYVEPNSIGEKAGLLPGDILMTLNGKPSEQYDMLALGTIIRGTETLRLEVDRDGEMQTIEIH